MGLLGVLHLRLVGAGLGRQIGLAERLADLLADIRQGLGRERDGIRTHICDVSRLVQTLGDTHDLACRNAQLVAALLLERARHERRLRRLAIRLVLHAAHYERATDETVAQAFGSCAIDHGHALFGDALLVEVLAGGDAGAVERLECGDERGLGISDRFEVPIDGRDVGHALLFALDDEANGWALHATRRQPAVDLAPEDRGYLISKEAVEDATGFGGVDQLVIDVARMGDCFFDCGLGDLVEDHAADRHLRLQVFEEVGGDRLALAVFVGCEVQLGGVLQRTLQLLDHRAATLSELIRWLERVLHVDRQPLAR